MRKYKVKFLKSMLTQHPGQVVKMTVREFYVYAEDFDKADRIVKEKLRNYQELAKGNEITYWMDAIGRLAISNY